MNAHLGADQIGSRRGTILGDGFSIEHKINRNCRLVAMRNRGDDIFGAKSGIPAKEDFGVGGLKCFWVNNWHIPLTKFDADILFDPGKGIVLANG